MSILLKNCKAITLNEKDDILDSICIGIKFGKIDYIGEYKDDLKERYSKILELNGKSVMPGFINCHSHSAMTLFRNYADDLKLMDWLFKRIFPLEDKLDDEGVYLGTCLAALEMIKGGTTTFSDMYMFMNSASQAAIKSGMRAVLCRGLTGDNKDSNDIKIKESIALYEDYNGASNGRIKVMLGPHSVYTCSYEYLEKINSISDQYNIPIHIHLSETKDEVNGCIKQYGISPVKLLDKIGMLKQNTLAAHCVVLSEEDIEILKNNKVNVVHNVSSNLKLASGIAPIKDMLDKGINVCLGTDGAASNNNLDMIEEMRLTAYIQKVIKEDPSCLPVDTALKMAITNGAKALDIKAGAIKEGYCADLIVINTEKPYYYPKYNIKSALVYSGSSSDVETVIIDGRLVMEKGVILTLDEEKIYYDVQKYIKRF